MKQRIDLIANETTYERLVTFETVTELNEAVRQFKRAFGVELTATDLAVLDILHRHSCRYFGVSFLRKSRIADMVSKSRRTVIRVVKKLAELGIVKQYELKRATDMQQTSNAIVIQAFVTQEKPADVTHKTTPKPLKQEIKEQERKDACESAFRYDYTFVSATVPQAFVNGVAPFFRDADEVYRLWGRLKLAAKHSGMADYLHDHIDDSVKTFKEAIYAYKNRHIKSDIYGYLYGAWRNATAVLARKIHANSVPYLYNWLED